MEREEAERETERLRAGRDAALQQVRDLQMQVLELEQERDEHQYDSDEEEVARRKRTTWQPQEKEALQKAYEAKEQVLKETIQKLQEDLEEARAATVQQQKESLVRDPSEVASLQKEVTRLRIQLADAERQQRQLQRSLQASEQRQKQLIRDKEQIAAAARRLPVVEEELTQLRQAHVAVQEENKAWKDFEQALQLEVPELHRGGPPETSTILRFLESNAQQRQDLQRRADHWEAECKRQADLKIEPVVKTANREEAALARQWKAKVELAESRLESETQQVALYKREAESLRSLIQTFEEQAAGGAGGDRSGSSKVDTSVATLQLSLDTSQKQGKLLEEKCQSLDSQLQKAVTEKASVEAELDRVKEKYGKLREALTEQQTKAAAAEERAVQAEVLSGKGSFDPAMTRVLRFTGDTPLVQALKEEISVLKRQVEAAGEKKKASSLAPNPDKLNQRLKENFKEQVALFREGVYLMTGYKVDMLPVQDQRPTFRIRSVFAEHEEDHLLLKWPKNVKEVSSLDLLNTDFAKVLSTTPSYEYMTKFGSLPAFLASVQLSLFEKQTMM
jgi:hypothetical protein